MYPSVANMPYMQYKQFLRRVDARPKSIASQNCFDIVNGFPVTLMVVMLYTSVLFCSNAKTLDVSQISCLKIKDLIPDTQDGLTYVFYIRMDGIADFITWKHLATCLRMWDLDARGFHNSMWRFWLKKHHVIVVGCPASKYCSHKPDNLEPLYIPEKVKRPMDD